MNGQFSSLPPSHIAVVLVDVQNDLCHPDASGGASTNTHDAAAALRPHEVAADAARLGAHVTFALTSPGRQPVEVEHGSCVDADGLCADGSWGTEPPGPRLPTAFGGDSSDKTARDFRRFYGPGKRGTTGTALLNGWRTGAG